MGRLYAGRAIVLAMLSSAACAVAAPTSAGDTAGFMPQFGGSQFMLFVSRPIGLHRSGASTFGVRYERAYSVTSDPALQFCAPVRHHALVELQLVHGNAARFQFGSRVTWDLGRRQLGPTALLSSAWSMPADPAMISTLAAWAP